MHGRWAEVNEKRAPGRDQRVGVPEFYKSVEYIYRLMKEMSRAK
jgi:hypothetical protein